MCYLRRTEEPGELHPTTAEVYPPVVTDAFAPERDRYSYNDHRVLFRITELSVPDFQYGPDPTVARQVEMSPSVRARQVPCPGLASSYLAWQRLKEISLMRHITEPRPSCRGPYQSAIRICRRLPCVPVRPRPKAIGLPSSTSTASSSSWRAGLVVSGPRRLALASVLCRRRRSS